MVFAWIKHLEHSVRGEEGSDYPLGAEMHPENASPEFSAPADGA